MKIPTIIDVAKKAGVSKATVSNVFNNKPNVSEEVIEKVLKAAEELMYSPNKLAAGLTTKRTGIVGLFLEDVKSFRQIEYHLIEGVVLGLNKYEYKVLIYKALDNIILLNSEPIDGAIIQAPLIEDIRIKDLVNCCVPICLIGQAPAGYRDIYSVDVDNVDMTYNIVKLLIEMGHDNIGFINSQSNMTITIDRLKGYLKALNEYGIEFNPAYVYNCNNTEEMGERLAHNILNFESVTAIVVESDEVAKGAYKAIKDKGLKIPEDISVFALGGKDRELDPRVSTVDVDYRLLGRTAASDIASLINGKIVDNKTIFNLYKIIETGSIRNAK